MPVSTKKLVILMVGYDIDRPSGQDVKFAVNGEHSFRFAARGYRNAAQIIPALAARSDLDLLHIGNETKLSRVQLVEECRALAKALGTHPNNPWVNFEKPEMNFLSTIFSQQGVKVYGGDTERVQVQRWADIALERSYLTKRKILAIR